MRPFLLGFLTIAAFSVLSSAQTTRPIPTFTTEDVISSPSAPSAAPGKPVTNTGNTKKDAVKTEPGDKAGGEKKQGDTKKQQQDESEKAWNERLKQSQEKLNDLKRRADQSELEIIRLRNYLSSAQSRAPETNSQVMTKINGLAGEMNQLRAAAQLAQKDLDTVVSEGNSKGYKILEPSLTNEKGEPDSDAYRTLTSEYQQEIKDAQSRIEILRVRLNGVQAETLRKANGDNFALNRLKAERESITDEIQMLTDKIEELNKKIQLNQQHNSPVKNPKK